MPILEFIYFKRLLEKKLFPKEHSNHPDAPCSVPNKHRVDRSARGVCVRERSLARSPIYSSRRRGCRASVTDRAHLA